MRTFVSMLAVLMMMVTAAPRAQAQDAHAAPQSALDAALQQHVAADAADREAVLRVLEQGEVQAVAGRMGVDLTRAAAAIATLDGAELAQLAAQAQQVEEALAGGQSRIVISTTAIIIALLVIILIVLAAD
mgnify:CR=1 FL=1